MYRNATPITKFTEKVVSKKGKTAFEKLLNKHNKNLSLNVSVQEKSSLISSSHRKQKFLVFIIAAISLHNALELVTTERKNRFEEKIHSLPCLSLNQQTDNT